MQSLSRQKLTNAIFVTLLYSQFVIIKLIDAYIMMSLSFRVNILIRFSWPVSIRDSYNYNPANSH